MNNTDEQARERILIAFEQILLGVIFGIIGLALAAVGIANLHQPAVILTVPGGSMFVAAVLISRDGLAQLGSWRNAVLAVRR